jgi:hypothetical protein
MYRQISNPQGYAELLSRFGYRRIVSIGLISLKMARVLSMYPVLLLEAEQSCTTRKWDDADLQIKKRVVSAQAFEVNPHLLSSGSQQGCLTFCKVCALITVYHILHMARQSLWHRLTWTYFNALDHCVKSTRSDNICFLS